MPMQPSPMAETSRPSRPRVRRSMPILLDGAGRLAASLDAAERSFSWSSARKRRAVRRNSQSRSASAADMQASAMDADGAVVAVEESRAESAVGTTTGGAWVLAATVAASSMAFIDMSVVNVALPVLQRAIGASFAEAQWVIEAYTLLLSALTLLGGTMGDIHGRRRVFALGILVFALASLGCGLAGSPAALIVARA